MLVRSWNLFHGNASPPRRHSYLEEMVRLATSDDPDLLLLQEVPAWALARLAGWSGMTVVGDVAQRPRFGPVPIPTSLGRLLTSIHLGILRSAFAGQANAILVGSSLRVAERSVHVLNPAGFRQAEAETLRLSFRARFAWAKERRICQAVRLSRSGAGELVVANLHATSSPDDARLPAAEVRRAATWVERIAGGVQTVVFGGDFNVEPHSGATLPDYSNPGPGLDHLVVRGAEPSPLRVWPDERRRREGMLLSDHAPIELDLP